MKKMLALLMALVMVLGMVPTAWATTGGTPVAKIGEKEFSTLKEAVDYKVEEDTKTIVLLSDVNNTERIDFKSNITIDLNGYTWNDTQNGLLPVWSKHLKITDSSVAGTGKMIGNSAKQNLGVFYVSGGTLTLEKGVFEDTGNISFAVVKPAGDSTDPTKATKSVVNVEAGATIKSTNGYAVIADRSVSYKTEDGKYFNYSEVNIRGKIETQYSLYTNGTVDFVNDTYCPAFNVYEGAEIVGDCYGAGYAVWNIYGGTITGNNIAVEIRAGELNISGGEFTSTATEFSFEANDNGSTTSGAAIAVSQHTTERPIDVAITGGTFNGRYALYEDDSHNQPESVDVDIAVSNGVFNGAVASENKKLSIVGGTFTTDPTDYVAEGYKAVAGDDGYTVVAKDYVAQVGGTKYETLAEAVAQGGEVVMLKNAALTERPVVAEGKSVTLDLAGYTITLPTGGDDVYRAILNKGTLTIKDSSGNNAGKIVSDRAVVQNWGILTVESGYLKGAASGGMSVISNGFVDQNGTNPEGTHTATIKGGILEGSLPLMNDGEAVIVTGGTFIGTGSEDVDDMILARNGKVTISGGTFNIREITKEEDATIEISGGTYSIDPRDYLAAGYGVDKVSDTEYVVGAYTAKIGSVTYENLTKAAGAAKANDTILMLANDATTEVELKEGVKLDTNGFDLAVTPTAPTDFVAVKVGNIWSVSEEIPVDDAEIVDNAETVFAEAGTEVKAPSEEITEEDEKKVAEDMTNKGASVDVPETILNEYRVFTQINAAVESQMTEAGVKDTDVDKIVVTPVTSKRVVGVVTDDAGKPTDIKFDVNAYLSVQIVKDDGTRIDVSQPIDLSESRTTIPVKLPVPEEWNDGKVYLTHEKEDGRRFFKTLVPVGGFVEIPNSDGFSTFTLSTEKPADYPSYGGGGGSYVSGHLVTSTLKGIEKVYVDGVLVDSKNYTVSGGDVTLKQSFLDGLKAGTHTVKLIYGDRQATGTFTTKGTGTVQSAKTFDAGIALYAGMAISSAMGAAYVMKKKH